MSDKHVEAFKSKHAKPGEEVREYAPGYIGSMMGSGKDTQHNGALIVTGERVVFYRKGFVGEVFQTIPLSKLTSVESKTLLGHRTIELHTSHDSLEFKTFVAKEQFQALYDAIEHGRDARPTSATANQTSTDPLAQIKKLAELRDAGIITQEEFESKKAELMTRV
jgi:hypothetical protein